MKRNLLMLGFLTLVGIVSIAPAQSGGPPCLTHAQMYGITSALDYSDETIGYIFWGIEQGNLTREQFIADIESLYITNNAIRWNLGVPQH